MAEKTGEEYAAHEEVIAAITILILTVIMLVILIVHARYVYQDFFTPDRSSLNHRRNKPSLSPGYKRMGYITLSCVSLYFISIFATAIQYNFSIKRCMFGWTIPEKVGFFGSKALLYLTYVLRLHEVYGQSSYGYKQGALKCVAVTVVIYCTFMLFFIEIVFTLFPHHVADTDDSFPFYCQHVTQEPWVTIGGLGILLFDLIASITSIIAFNRPLKKVVEATLKYSDQKMADADKQKRFGKMMYTGYKYKILVWVASFTTLLWIVALFTGVTFLATFFINIDLLINPVCLLLMTPYYPSNIFYENLCCCCIWCCDRSGESYKSKADEADRDKNSAMLEASQTVPVSVDTSKAFPQSKSLPVHSEVKSDEDDKDGDATNQD